MEEFKNKKSSDSIELKAKVTDTVDYDGILKELI